MQAATSKADWQEALSNLITDPQELLNLLGLDPALLEAARAAAKLFPLKVTHSYVARMQKGDPRDPLLMQVLPLNKEMTVTPGYETDPLQELSANPVPGLLHKYHGRVLVTLTSACAVHCRFCFRRHFPYEENNPGTQGWEKIFSYIANDASITEVILSGGDPLSVSDKLLTRFTNELQKISHVKLLRMHTRLPVVLPERVTEELLHWLSNMSLTPVMVLHVNHSQEIDATVMQALKRIYQTGARLLNQSVLLKDINDDVETLARLSETLFDAGVTPYYLHVLDKVQGAAHFDTDDSQALRLHQDLTHRLPGYLVPRLVRETPGELSKSLLS